MQKLVYATRLVLYWHHIGLHEKQNDKQIQSAVRNRCRCLPQFSKSREAKRESQTFVDVLAAEDVGRFQDRNVTEAFSVLVA